MNQYSDQESAELKSRMEIEMGEILRDALSHPRTIEILLNADGSLWQECLGESPARIGSLSRSNAYRLFGTIAHSLGKIVDASHPILEGRLTAWEVRFEGCVPPISKAPIFALRKPASSVIPLERYLTEGALDEAHHLALIEVLQSRRNVLIVGATGSGKTTFANALLAEIGRLFPSERIVTLEDTQELQVNVANYVSLFTSHRITLRDLLRSTMRLLPDRIVVGETRGGEALELLKAWNTGHRGGLSTIHANSAAAALLRLEQLCAEASAVPSQELIAEAIDVIVFLSRADDRLRGLAEAVTVDGYDSRRQSYLLSELCRN